MLTKTLKFVWVLSSLAVVVVTLARYETGPSSDIGIFLVFGMLFLAFPGSLLVAGLFALLALIQEQSGLPLLDFIGSNYVGFSVMWLVFFVVGYAQWFVLLPWLWRKWKASRAGGAAAKQKPNP